VGDDSFVEGIFVVVWEFGEVQGQGLIWIEEDLKGVRILIERGTRERVVCDWDL
jgi:hypothetical protein